MELTTLARRRVRGDDVTPNVRTVRVLPLKDRPAVQTARGTRRDLHLQGGLRPPQRTARGRGGGAAGQSAQRRRRFPIPAAVVLGEKDYDIRYYGIAARFEFASIMEDTLMIAKRDSGPERTTREKLPALTEPVHLQVLATPT